MAALDVPPYFVTKTFVDVEGPKIEEDLPVRAKTEPTSKHLIKEDQEDSEDEGKGLPRRDISSAPELEVVKKISTDSQYQVKKTFIHYDEVPVEEEPSRAKTEPSRKSTDADGDYEFEGDVEDDGRMKLDPRIAEAEEGPCRLTTGLELQYDYVEREDEGPCLLPKQVPIASEQMDQQVYAAGVAYVSSTGLPPMQVPIATVQMDQQVYAASVAHVSSTGSAGYAANVLHANSTGSTGLTGPRSNGAQGVTEEDCDIPSRRRFCWRVTDRMLTSTNAELISHMFHFQTQQGELILKMVLQAKVAQSGGRGGSSFKAAAGRGVVKVKCGTAGAPNLTFWFCVGSPREGRWQGPVEADFQRSILCGENTEWDFKEHVVQDMLHIYLDVSETGVTA